MNIHFGLYYTSNAFVDLKAHGGICLDHMVAGPNELLNMLEFRLGIHHTDIGVTDRQAVYYAAFKQVMAKGKNIFTESWDRNSLGVSNECLKWRDALREYGWNAQMTQPSPRLEVLAKVEQHFYAPSFGDRIERILPFLNQCNPLPPQSCIKVAAHNRRDLPPALVDVFDALAASGTEIVYEPDVVLAPDSSNLAKIQRLLISNEQDDTLKKDDKTFQIWTFPTELDAARYIAAQPQELFNAYITADGKLLDNVQRMLEQPTSGSSIHHAHPQIVQLFKLGLSLFEYPFNIRNLISWLQMPIHPIKSELRRDLVKVLLNTGGYKNEEYKSTIENYRKKLKDEAENEVLAEEAVQKLDRTLDIFIPEAEANGVDKSSLLIFINSLNSWCAMMTNLEDLNPLYRSQLGNVANLCSSLARIVEEETDDAMIPFRKLEGWTSSLYACADFDIYKCQAGSRWTVTAANIAEAADHILWTDCYNCSTALLNTDFLNATERQQLAEQGCRFWDTADFNAAFMRTLLRPVLQCKQQLVVVVTHSHKGVRTEKHPLLIRLEKAFPKTLTKVTSAPDNHKAEKKSIEEMNNYLCDNEVVFNNKEFFNMPVTESYSSLENLIQYPLDYVMDRILRLRDRSSAEMDSVATVKGNVAHAVIEELFKGNSHEIEENVEKNFTTALLHMTEEKGAILLLQENIIEWRLFCNQLKECLEALLQIIKTNNLTVVGREHRVSRAIGLLEDRTLDPTVNGFVDMTLKNEQGEFFVFDFKWTSSRKYHKELLERNASIQLALYEHLIAQECQKPVVATAYFTMPWHKLYTTSDRIAAGIHVEHITPENVEALLPKIMNAYRYRREQLLQGIIENGEACPLDEIPYAMEQQKKGLVPLSPDYSNPTVHSTNLFSNYSCFKFILP